MICDLKKVKNNSNGTYICSYFNTRRSRSNTVQPFVQKYDDTLLDRFSDPGAGAMSYHPGHIFYSTTPIKAGQELFAGEFNNLLFVNPYVVCIYMRVNVDLTF